MEENTKKCSLENHSENRAVLYCYDCKIYMCNKCENHHSELFKNHHQIKLDKFKNINEIFTGICKEKNHPYDLKYEKSPIISLYNFLNNYLYNINISQNDFFLYNNHIL